ncbi:MAG: hypothetical protein NT080_09340 [Spirochaetes bacterium]|nr:hypothetical protein [Spirochaetota bacterium]
MIRVIISGIGVFLGAVGFTGERFGFNWLKKLLVRVMPVKQGWMAEGIWLLLGIVFLAILLEPVFRSRPSGIAYCQNCGWKGSKDRFISNGGCPNCGSDLYSEPMV